MFRISQYMRELDKLVRGADAILPPHRQPPGPVVIWNLIRRCNLTCKHCYSISADRTFPGELSTEEVFSVMDDLKAFGVPVLILSGGEPLLRAGHLRHLQARQGHGLLHGPVHQRHPDHRAEYRAHRRGRLRLRGHQHRRPARHPRHFRRRKGAFDESMHGIRLCREHGIKVGLRFTITQDNAHELPQSWISWSASGGQVLPLAPQLRRARQPQPQGRRGAPAVPRAMDLLFDTCWADIQAGRHRGVRHRQQRRRRRVPAVLGRGSVSRSTEAMRARLAQWGGNSSRREHRQHRQPGQRAPGHLLVGLQPGQRARAALLADLARHQSDPLMAGLKQQPRPVKGRCGECNYLAVCGGNTRVRAWR
jgi:Fe-coproporphyrin III synthase